EWGPEDLAQVAGAGPHAILAPKVNTERDVRAYLAAMNTAPPHTELWVMAETVACFNGNLPRIAAIGSEPSSRLTTLVFGANDIKKEMRALDAPRREPLQYALAQTVIAARDNNLHALDGVFNKFVGKDKSKRKIKPSPQSSSRSAGKDILSGSMGKRSSIRPRSLSPTTYSVHRPMKSRAIKRSSTSSTCQATSAKASSRRPGAECSRRRYIWLRRKGRSPS